MQNLNLILLSGGCNQCTPTWNEDPSGKGNCYKLYFPVEGKSRIFADGEWYELEEGNAYFINGFILEKQRCDDYMKVYWLHFIPESQFLSMYFNNLKPVYCWEQGNALLASIDYKKIPLLFDNQYTKSKELVEMSSLSLNCYINSIALMFISDMVEQQNSDFSSSYYHLYFKLKPALEFINDNYMNDLKLEDISQKIFLNPIYFSRLFKKCFKVTPSRYINMIRMNEACRLLMKTDLSILEISENTGFCNQFYFSKVFKHNFRKTPLEYRITKLSP
ncbi:MAG TPA: AraC family transcriptional regulator [Ruminiclostridium sp.]